MTEVDGRTAPSGQRFWLTARSFIPATAIALGLFLLLALFVAADPAPNFTFSGSPWTDEAWNAVGPRNLVLLGHWSTDQWNLYLVELPFSLLLAGAFEAFGVGIVQARLVCIALVALTALALGLGLRRPFGIAAATVAALALATSELILYYGRLVYLEDLVILALTLGVVSLAKADDHPLRWGFVGGVAFAIAVGAKATAIPPAAGALLGVGLYGLLRDRQLLRWVAGAVAVLLAAGLAWWLVLYLPQQAEMADNARILAPVQLPKTLGQLRAQLLHLPRSDGLWHHTWPLLTSGTAGALLALLHPDGRRGVRGAVLYAALGWLMAGGATFALVSYQPNRYLVPLLPALAILLACGTAAAISWLTRRTTHWFRVVAVGGAAVALAVPGLSTYASWMRQPTYSLPTMQEEVRSLIPPGAVSYGALAPAMLMRAPVVTIARLVGAQAGADVYATRGAHWYVMARNAVVEPVASAHPKAWAERTLVYCARWAGADVCLYHVP